MVREIVHTGNMAVVDVQIGGALTLNGGINVLIQLTVLQC